MMLFTPTPSACIHHFICDCTIVTISHTNDKILTASEEPEATEEGEDKKERKAVADGATDVEEPTEEGAGEDGVKMDIPPMPGLCF